MKAALRSAYQKVYHFLPPSLAEGFSDAMYLLARRPLVYHDPARHPVRGLSRGVVTFSIDFEMAWATQYSRSAAKDSVHLGLRERDQVPRILAKFNEWGIPATWATVGHLFLHECVRGSNGLAHPEMPRPPHFDAHWRFTSGDWYQHDPCTDVTRDPAWYAPDLVRMILGSNVKHEIGCHGFSHLGYGLYAPEEVSGAELDACLAAMKPFGVRPVSFVFPGNDAGKHSLLVKKGFTAVRDFPVPWAEISLPLMLESGLWGVHSTSYVDTSEGVFNAERRLKRLVQCMEKASETHLAAHIWFHPSLPGEQMETVLFPLLEECARFRDAGLIDIMTMEALVDATARAMRAEGKLGE